MKRLWRVLSVCSVLTSTPFSFAADELLSASNGQALVSSFSFTNLTTAVDPSFNAVLDGAVSLIRQQADDKLIVAGGFVNVSGQLQPGLARLNEDARSMPASPLRQLLVQSCNFCCSRMVGS